MKKAFIIFLINILFFLPSFASNWYQFSEKKYIDISGVENYNYNSKASKTFLTKEINNNSSGFSLYEKKYKIKISYKTVKYVINCEDKKIAIKQMSFYDANNNFIDEIFLKSNEVKYDDIDRGTVGDSLYKIVCTSRLSELQKNALSSKNSKQTQTSVQQVPKLKPNIQLSHSQYYDEKNNATAGTKEPDFGPYMRDLQRRIKMNWEPPKGEQSKRVVLLFKIAKDGRLLNVSVHQSSGDPETDQAAIIAVKITAPFKPLPQEFKGKSVDVQFTFDYNVFSTTNSEYKRPADMYNDINEYIDLVKDRFKVQWEPPRGIETNKVTLVFTIDKNADIKNVYIEKSSGDNYTDSYALRTVDYIYKNKLLTPLPQNYNINEITLRVTLGNTYFVPTVDALNSIYKVN